MPIDLRTCAWCLVAFCMAPGFCQPPATTQTPVSPQTPPQNNEDTVAHFGTTVFISSGLRGDIYFIHPNSARLPRFEKLKPVGTIYTSELNIPRTEFTAGFPGVTGRFEWFAIDYTGKFWIDKPGKYTWALLSDDGSKLHIDGKEIIDNDGTHPPKGVAGNCKLKSGEHRIRVSYFQGPRTQVALILAVVAPDEKVFRLFNTEDFLSPEVMAEMKKSRPDAVRPSRKPAEEFVMGPVIPH